MLLKLENLINIDRLILNPDLFLEFNQQVDYLQVCSISNIRSIVGID